MSIKTKRVMDNGKLLRAVMCAVTLAFLIGAFFAPDLKEMLPGLRRICLMPAQLTKDYFKPEIGSISGTMLNYFLVGAVCCALMFLPEATVNGGTVLAYFLTLGFCSYGMNILNIIPLMLGVAVYALIRKQPFGKFLNFYMFATAAVLLPGGGGDAPHDAAGGGAGAGDRRGGRLFDACAVRPFPGVPQGL